MFQFHVRVRRCTIFLLLLFCIFITFYACQTSPEDVAATVAPVGAAFVSPTWEQASAAAEPLATKTKISDEEEIRIIALKADDTGIAVDTAFRIENFIGDAAELRQKLRLNPSVEFTLTAQSDKSWLLEPAQKLNLTSVYTITLDGALQNSQQSESASSWAFQTRNSFYISKMLPGYNATDVPINTGIEVTFSRSDIVNFEEAFSITPKAEGRFEQHDATWVFVPEGLEEATTYSVTLSAELQTSDGQLLGHSYQLSFATPGGSQKVTTYTDSRAESFAYGDPLVIEFSIYPKMYVSFDATRGEPQPREIDLQVFHLSPDDYRQMLRRPQQNRDDQLAFETDALAPPDIYRLQAWPDSSNNQSYYGRYIILLPEALSEGHYLLQAIIEENAEEDPSSRLQKLIQIHPYSLYALGGARETLLWVNDTVSGEPVGGARVSLAGQEAETDPLGVAKIVLPPQEDANSMGGQQLLELVEIMPAQAYPDALPYIDRLNLGSTGSSYPQNVDYLSLLYLDRAAYQPDDLIEFWGVVKPRLPGGTLPETVVLRLQGGYQSDLAALTLTPDENGRFNGSFTLHHYLPGYYSLRLEIDGSTGKSESFIVSSYVKPLYLLEAQSDQLAYFDGDLVTIPAEVSFYDGTPAPELTLMLASGPEPLLYTASDILGQAEVSLPATYSPGYSPYATWRPWQTHDSVTIIENEEAIVSKPISYWVFPTDLMLPATAKPTDTGTGFILNMAAHRIDLERLKNTGQLPPDGYYSALDSDSFKGSAVSQELSIRLVAVDFIKTPISNHYDYLSKQTITRYEYNRQERDVAIYTVVTDDLGQAELNLPVTYRDDGYYYAEISALDSKERVAYERIYLFENSNYYYTNTTFKHYQLQSGTQAPNWYNTTLQLKLDEKTPFQLFENQIPVTGDQGRVLQIMHFDQTLQYTQSGTRFEVSLSREHLPNAYLYAAYFDGHHVFAVKNYFDLQLDPADYKLNLEIETLGGPYHPGDRASVRLRVTDVDGVPQVTTALLSIVDEAAFAIREQNLGTLKRFGLYYPISHPYRVPYASYVQHALDNSPGGKGGDGARNDPTRVRSDFRDTAAFITVTTDAYGVAEIQFVLPDQPTTWRITALAVADTDDMFSFGIGIAKMPAALPFCILEIMNSTLVAGDDLVVSLRGRGDALPRDSFVEYTAELQGPQGVEPIVRQSSAQGSEQLYLNFGKLSEGEYTLTIHGNTGELRDSLSLPITVELSRLELPISEEFSLQDLERLVALRSPLNLVFYDARVYPWLRSLEYLQRSWSTRSDQRFSRALAHGLQQRYEGHIAPDADLIDIYAFSGEDVYDKIGGIRLLPYAGADLELTARFCLAAPDLVSTSTLQYYFSAYQYSTTPLVTRDQLLLLLARAALKHPVLTDLHTFFADAETLTLEEQLLLCLALAEIGDTTTARQLYINLTQNRLFAQGPWVYLESGIDADHTFKYTALCLQTAIRLNDAQTEAMLRYLLENTSDEFAVDLEILDYALRNQPRFQDPAVFSWLENGTRREVVLTYGAYRLTLAREQLQAADFTALYGLIGVQVSYMAAPQDLWPSEQQQISLRKSWRNPLGPGLLPGNLVAIEIQPDFGQSAPGDDFLICDVLPSGMRFASFTHNPGIYLVQQDDQTVLFCYQREYAKDGPIIYYARCLLPGEYVVEVPFIRHEKTGIWGVGHRDTLRISDGGFTKIAQ